MRPHQDDLKTQDTNPRRLDRIVVGVDFTEPSLAIAEWVGRCLARSAEVMLVHVTPMALIPNGCPAASDRITGFDRRSGDRVRSLRGALRGLASTMGRTRTSVDVRIGDPAQELAACADFIGADLVVVGGSMRYHIAPRYETATTERVLRRTSRPVLVARNVQAAPTTILADVSDDVDAVSVLRAACMVARPCAARVEGLQVTGRDSPAFTKGRDRSSQLAGTAPNAATAIRGERVQSILHAARRLRADIIAVGTRTRVGEDVPTDDSDDAAHRLLRRAMCSVLVVPHCATPHPLGVRREAMPTLLTWRDEGHAQVAGLERSCSAAGPSLSSGEETTRAATSAGKL